MEKLFDILKEKLSHNKVELEKERLEIFQFPIFKDKQQVDFAVLESGTFHPPHIHENGSANLYVICGKGEIILDGGTSQYEEGDTFFIPKGTSHGFNTIEKTILLSIQDKPILENGNLDFRYESES